MKKWSISFFFLFFIYIFNISGISYAATVGNPLDLDVPKRSALLREEAIGEALDEYEQVVKIKASLDLEMVFSKDLDSSTEIEKAEIEGQWAMAKFGITLFNRIEPYVKLGISNLEAKWKQNSTHDIRVQTDSGLAWGVGIKGIIWEFDNFWDIRITGDAQYRTTEPDVNETSANSVGISDTGADFKIEEWQASILLSKKFELPLKLQSVYIVPYTGMTICDSIVDIKFRDANETGAYTTDYNIFEANNDSIYGFVLGCDILPTLTSSFMYSMELRLLDETALTLGGTMKF